jgi:hypothetical protein
VRIVDDAVMARLTAVGLDVMDGYVPTKDDGKTVEYPLPFVVYYGAPGVPSTMRLTGRRQQNNVGFMVTCVGIDRNQTKWAQEKARGALDGRRLVVPGHKAGLITLLTSPWVWRDDDMIRPDGKPLFYSRDTYEVPVFNTYTPEGA